MARVLCSPGCQTSELLNGKLGGISLPNTCLSVSMFCPSGLTSRGSQRSWLQAHSPGYEIWPPWGKSGGLVQECGRMTHLCLGTTAGCEETGSQSTSGRLHLRAWPSGMLVCGTRGQGHTHPLLRPHESQEPSCPCGSRESLVYRGCYYRNRSVY